MAGEPSTLQVILSNLRNAAVDFVAPYRNPAGLPQALANLLGELGIANPQDTVSSALQSAVSSWTTLADQLSGLNLNVLDPAQIADDLQKKGRAVTDAIDGIRSAAGSAVSGVAGIGAAVAALLPVRLFDYIVYEFLTKSHPKIAGILLLLGILRRERQSAGGNAVLVDGASIRIFDLAQLVRVVTHPREAFLTALKWGRPDFNAQPAVDGLVLLLGTLPGTQVPTGSEKDLFPLLDEAEFVTVDNGVAPSPRRTLVVPTLPSGTTTLSFVGLHQHGLGLLVPSPVDVSGGLGALQLPQSPANFLFALTPGPDPASDPPQVEKLG